MKAFTFLKIIIQIQTSHLASSFIVQKGSFSIAKKLQSFSTPLMIKKRKEIPNSILKWLTIIAEFSFIKVITVKSRHILEQFDVFKKTGSLSRDKLEMNSWKQNRLFVLLDSTTGIQTYLVCLVQLSGLTPWLPLFSLE